MIENKLIITILVSIILLQAGYIYYLESNSMTTSISDYINESNFNPINTSEYCINEFSSSNDYLNKTCLAVTSNDIDICKNDKFCLNWFEFADLVKNSTDPNQCNNLKDENLKELCTIILTKDEQYCEKFVEKKDQETCIILQKDIKENLPEIIEIMTNNEKIGVNAASIFAGIFSGEEKYCEMIETKPICN